MQSGRYGADRLGFVLVIISIITTGIAALIGAKNLVMRIILIVVSAAVLFYEVYRMFSRNRKAREREMRAFEQAKEKIILMFCSKDSGEQKEPDSRANEANRVIAQANANADKPKETDAQNESDGFKRFKCPQCKKPLKVPKGKGYIKVVCPACSHKFTKHT